MFVSSSPARHARRLVIPAFAGLAFATVSLEGAVPSAPSAILEGAAPSAPSDAVHLEPYLTTATRSPAAPQTIGSAVDSFSASDFAQRQITSVADALISTPGAAVMQSGGPGSVASVFMRGANSNQTLFLVDGIRFNDPNTDYQVFLGGGSLGAHDRLEIARGPQSTLYGAEAIGGVVSLRMDHGTGAPTSAIAAEAGSFATFSGAVAAQGSAGANAWNLSLNGAHSENDRPNNDFERENVALRLDRSLNETAAVGATLRWFHGQLGSPGDRFTNDPNNRETESNLLATAFADFKFAPAWTAHVILGGQDRRYVNDMPAPNPPYDSPSARTTITNRRGVIDAQTTFTGVERNRITAGVTSEEEQTRDNGFGAIDRRQTLLAVFAEDEFSPIDAVTVTAGLRHDRFNTFGHATTGRATIAWLPIPKTLKLRASYGTGFRSPSFLDLYGQDAYYVGNPTLRPERARGYDAGADYYLPNGRGTLSATWFQTDFRDLIEYDFTVFPSTVVNVGKARTRGVELSGRTLLSKTLEASLSYTYLQALSLDSAPRTELLRRPRHQVSADLHNDFGGGFTAGAGVLYIGHRADVDAQTFATITDPDYAIVRVYAAWQVTANVTVKARLENALNRHYEPVNGYPALGLGAFGAVEYRF